MTALAAYVAVLETHRMGDSQPSSVVSPASDMSGARLVRRADALCDQFCDVAWRVQALGRA